MKHDMAGVRTLTQLDHVRIHRLLADSPVLIHRAASEMREVLDVSDVVESPAIEPTVVTMYTQVSLRDVAGGDPWTVTLCYPADAEPAKGFISVLSPLGASLLGLRAGDVARWQPPSGDERRALIVEVLFQPEASGDYLT
jgi:regulator of nucleoside diphosphate kinase